MSNQQEKSAEFILSGPIKNREAADSMVNMASRIVDALEDSSAGRIGSPDSALTAAPEAIPVLVWASLSLEGIMSGGSLGDYFAERFPDETSSVALNTGFYAGVLACQKGLVDPNLFQHDGLNQGRGGEE